MHTKTFAFSLFLLLLSCAPIEGMEWTEFTDKAYGYQFRHPKNWKAKIYRSGIVVSETIAPSDKAGVQFRITGLNRSLDTFTDRYLQSVKQDLQAVLLNSSSGFLKDIEYREFSLKSQRGNQETYLYQMLLFFPDIGRVIIIQAGCSWQDRDIYQEALKKIAQSIKVNDLQALAK